MELRLKQQLTQHRMAGGECGRQAKPLLRKQVPGKASCNFLLGRPYRKPTQVDWCKSTKVIGRTLVKELGKKASVS